MRQAKRGSIGKRGKAAWALGVTGVSLVMTGGASATAPATDGPSQDSARRFIVGEEEISDVSLATFHVFDRENPPRDQGIRLARGGCGGCGHGGGCGGCAHAGGGGGCAHAGGCGGCAHAGGGGCAHAGGCGAAGGGAGRCAGGRCARGGRCACGGGWIGVACLGCAACSGTCLQWDPYLGQWIYVCY
jgi:hypothetical protein